MILAGAPPLLRVALREELPRTVPWALLLSVLSASSVAAYTLVLDDAESRQRLAFTVAANPALNLVFGVPRDLFTTDGFNAWRAGSLGALLVGLLAITVVVRHTRAEEDSGRAELVAAGVVGRGTALFVAGVVAVVVSVLASTLAAVVTVAVGGGVGPTVLICAGFASSGAFFAGVAAVAVQVGSDSRSATVVATSVLGVLYLARGYVDAAEVGGPGSWLTPFGWVARTHPATGDEWWPLLPLWVAGLALGAVGAVLQTRRDHGRGLVPGRPGRARGRWVRTLPGFVVRQMRSSVVAWWIGLATVGAVMGTLATTVGPEIADNPLVARILAAGLLDESSLTAEFVLTLLKVNSLLAAAAGAQVLTGLHADEVAGRLDPLLAAPVTRPRLFGWYVLAAHVASGVGLLLAAVLIGQAGARSSENPLVPGDVLEQGVLALGAVWLVLAVSVATVGAFPRVRSLGWVAIALTFVLTILGPMLELPDRVLAASPLWHVPRVDDPDYGTGWWVVWGLWLLLVVVGVAGHRRRDLE